MSSQRGRRVIPYVIVAAAATLGALFASPAIDVSPTTDAVSGPVLAGGGYWGG